MKCKRICNEDNASGCSAPAAKIAWRLMATKKETRTKLKGMQKNLTDFFLPVPTFISEATHSPSYPFESPERTSPPLDDIQQMPPILAAAGTEEEEQLSNNVDEILEEQDQLTIPEDRRAKAESIEKTIEIADWVEEGLDNAALKDLIELEKLARTGLQKAQKSQDY